MAILPKLNYTFNTISIKIPQIFNTEMDKLIVKSMELQLIPNSQNNYKKEQSWRTHPSQFQNLLQSNSNQISVVLT